MTVSQADKAKKFRALHEAPGSFVIPNPWDAGSARMLAGSGSRRSPPPAAPTPAPRQRDGKVSARKRWRTPADLRRDRVPVAADLEKGFGDVRGAAETIPQAGSVGLVGGSIEDASGEKEKPL